MKYNNKDLVLTNTILDGKVAWRSPSNIALIKYWGKFDKQIPANPSLSITLNNAYTETILHYSYKKERGIDVAYYFEDERSPAFEKKILKYLQSIVDAFPFLEQLKLKIYSKNTFPHSAGIASSASSMSALALCICSLEEKFFGTTGDFYKKASYFARLGSGSASRSVFGNFVTWGKSDHLAGSSDEYAQTFDIVDNSIFENLNDAILIVDSGEKEVSSTVGHGLMNGHDFAEQRFSQARKNLKKLICAMQNNDWGQFAAIVENEALSLHSMMMTSLPSFMLLKPGTIEIIQKLRSFRAETSCRLCFTLDAGPNVHLIYPKEESERVKSFIDSELRQHCENNLVIYDVAGKGPEQIMI